MGVRVTGDRDRAAMYDGTSGLTIGPVYKGHVNAKKELTEFLKWIPNRANNYTNDELGSLMTAFKVDKGWLDRRDWTTQVQDSEEILGREI